MYKRQVVALGGLAALELLRHRNRHDVSPYAKVRPPLCAACLLYTSDAADERSSVDLGGRRIIKKKETSSVSRCSR